MAISKTYNSGRTSVAVCTDLSGKEPVLTRESVIASGNLSDVIVSMLVPECQEVRVRFLL